MAALTVFLLVTSAVHTALCAQPECLTPLEVSPACVDRPDLLPYGYYCGDSSIDPPADDVFCGPIEIPQFQFFGVNYSHVYLIENGALSFGFNGSSCTHYRSARQNFPQSLRYCNAPVIAPFWNDVYLKFGGRLWFRLSNQSELLVKAASEIGSLVPAAWVFVATWENVAFWWKQDTGKNIRNIFQVALIADESRRRYYVMIRYSKLQWGSAPHYVDGDWHGNPDTGMGGVYAKSGFDAADRKRFVELPGSFTEDVMKLVNTSNVGIPGKWIYNVDNTPMSECPLGKFGSDCTRNCHCNNDTEQCDKLTGVCFTSGCAPGWKGGDCQQECKDGHFGLYCTKACQCNSLTEVCDKGSGFCVSGCLPGWEGSGCHQECHHDKFGLNCTGTCHCINATERCDKATGRCLSGCLPGWRGSDCQQECERGNFGLNCIKTCHCISPTETCDKGSGTCVSGCLPGWVGSDCQQECKDYKFGLNCTKSCHCNSDTEMCDKATGSCLSGCLVGWDGSDCQQECQDRTFGFECAKTCHCKNATERCDVVTGKCSSGCAVDWGGDDCQEDLADDSYSLALKIAGVAIGVSATVFSSVGVAMMFTNVGQSLFAWGGNPVNVIGQPGATQPGQVNTQAQDHVANSDNTQAEQKNVSSNLFSNDEQRKESVQVVKAVTKL